MRDEVIERHLVDIEKDIKILERLRGQTINEITSDALSYWGVLHGLQLCIQNVIDIGTHLIAKFSLAPASDYKGVMRELARAGIIPQALAIRLEDAVGFRNVLIHHYLDVKQEIVHQSLNDGLDDLLQFGDEVRLFLEKQADTKES